MALVKEYFDLTKKYIDEYGENTILLMQVGSFFEVYGKRLREIDDYNGSKISEFSKICELNISEKNVFVGKEKVYMAGFKDVAIDKYIRKIQDASFTAVVYTQDEQAKNTTRSLVGIFSPGTYFSLDSDQITNNTTCVWVDFIENKSGIIKGKYVVVGIANIDICTGKTSMFQFKEIYINNPTTYDELERFISIYKPSELILISNLPKEEINKIIKYANIQSKIIHTICLLQKNSLEKIENKNGTENGTENGIANGIENGTENGTENGKDAGKIKKALRCEKQIYQKEVCEKFYKNIDYSAFMQNFYENHIASQAFCYLLDFIYQHNPHLVHNINEPRLENYSDRLILANHSLKQLNIIDDNNYTGKYSSVLKMLNLCLTSMGKRQFAQQFLNPTMNEEFLNEEYNITEYMLEQKNKYDFLKNKLSDLKDISKWTRQMYMKKVSPKLIYQIYNNLIAIEEIYNEIKRDDHLSNYLLKSNSESGNGVQIGDNCKTIYNFILSAIDLDLAKDIDNLQNFEVNFIKRGVDKELDEKCEILIESYDKLEAIRIYLNSQISTYEKKTKTTDFVKINETEKNHFTLISTKRRCALLKENLSKVETIVKLKYVSSYDSKEKTFDMPLSVEIVEFNVQSNSNNSITTPFINSLCKNVSSLKVQLKDLTLRVYSNFIERFDQHKCKIDKVNQFITRLDVLYAKKNIAQKYNFCKPQIVECQKSFVDARNLRHCLIENLQQNELYVANDITLGKNESDGLLLYGTNAVGKTSFIRGIGIAVILAQAGLYVPCSAFFFKPFKYIFTRILGNDNIFEGLSTFAVEMSELRTILRLTDKNSLVLGDELCSGTESISATSIFVAGIQKLQQMQSSFIFATHLHEIVKYEEITSMKNVHLKHMAVIYDRENDVLIYDRKLKDGPGTNMYGLEVCKSLALPDDFLNAALEIRSKYHPENGASILSHKTSHFNSQKVVANCEKCGVRIGTEVHHLQHQADANSNGIINGSTPFHKNHLANLLTLCEPCHKEIHEKKSRHKKVKTTKGIKIEIINNK
jgi:DNA mismatch repair protein MutS